MATFRRSDTRLGVQPATALVDKGLPIKGSQSPVASLSGGVDLAAVQTVTVIPSQKQDGRLK